MTRHLAQGVFRRLFTPALLSRGRHAGSAPVDDVMVPTMTERSPLRRLRQQRGSALAAVLVAMLIAVMLYFVYFEGKKSTGERTGGQTAIDAAQNVACRSTRQLIERDIDLWSVGHPGEPPTLEALARSGLRVPTCPQGGSYSLVDRHVECSLHE